MKTIGLLGGLSWESTATYYKLINEGVKARLGGLHSAKICLYSVDFEEIGKLQHEENWESMAVLLSEAAQKVQAGGADFLVICSNTTHKVAPQIHQSISIPLLHIADVTAEALVSNGITKVGLLGTKFTMEQEFYKGRLAEKFNLEVVVPNTEYQDVVHEVIYKELCLGKILQSSREKYLHIIDSLRSLGAEAVILGCTEITLLVQRQHTTVPLYDTTTIHANNAVELALS